MEKYISNFSLSPWLKPSSFKSGSKLFLPGFQALGYLITLSPGGWQSAPHIHHLVLPWTRYKFNSLVNYCYCFRPKSLLSLANTNTPLYHYVIIILSIMCHWMYIIIICRFRATIYQCPETQAERREMLLGIQTRIEDLNTVSSPISLTLF